MKIGPYEILSELGRGGMGVVYRGIDRSLDRPVAIKLVGESIAHEEKVVERFLREARTMARITDPQVVQIFFIGEHEGRPFLAMEFIDGQNLADLLKSRGPLPALEACRLVGLAARGLAAAHRVGVIHRDVKPANLIATRDGGLKVTDFGIALALDQTTKLTGTGAIVGTPGYLSPEVCQGFTVDARSDLYSLGVVLYELLVGRLPYRNSSPYQLMMEIVTSDVPDLAALDPRIDPRIAAIVRMLLAKDPNQRFQSCEALIAALDALQGPAVAVLPPLPAAPVSPWPAAPNPVATPLPPATPTPLAAPAAWPGTPVPGAPGTTPPTAPLPAPAMPVPQFHSAPPVTAPSALQPPSAPWAAPVTPPPPVAAAAEPANVSLLMALCAGLTLLLLIAIWSQLSVLSALAKDWTAIAHLSEWDSAAEAAGLHQRQVEEMGVAMLVGVPVLLSFLGWTGLAHANLHRLRHPVATTPVWLGLLGWFLPLANLYFSARTAYELLRGSGAGPLAVPITILWWILAWASVGFFLLYSHELPDFATDNVGQFRGAMAAALLDRLCWALACLCLIGWSWMVTLGQARMVRAAP